MESLEVIYAIRKSALQKLNACRQDRQAVRKGIDMCDHSLMNPPEEFRPILDLWQFDGGISVLQWLLGELTEMSKKERMKNHEPA